MRIALDTMGGDFSPHNPVEGALQYLVKDDNNNEIVLLGDEPEIKTVIDHHHSIRKVPLERIHIVPTTQVVNMHDPAAHVMTLKPDSSMVKGLKMHKHHEVDAFISSGSTGAQMATSLLTLGRIKGVSRPALGSFFPSKKGVILLVDVGANAECKPVQLMQFAIMGSMYFKYILGVENPSIGLLNIGEEETKGTELYQATYRLMKEKLSDFSGNIEGRDILHGKCDIVVCDGFVGNVVLKFAESVFGVLTHSLKESIGKNIVGLIGAYLVRGAFRNMKKQYNYEEYGGAPLLGINGISIITHGSSSPKAISMALKVAERMVDKKLNKHIEEQMQLVNGG